jgi:hypothetical protein
MRSLLVYSLLANKLIGIYTNFRNESESNMILIRRFWNGYNLPHSISFMYSKDLKNLMASMTPNICFFLCLYIARAPNKT